MNNDALLEEANAGGAGHEEEQRGEKQTGDQHDAADLQLRPPDLSLTGHGTYRNSGVKQVLGSRFQVLGSRFQVPGSGFQVLGVRSSSRFQDLVPGTCSQSSATTMA